MFTCCPDEAAAGNPAAAWLLTSFINPSKLL
jgi:hypothetical protein